MKEIDYKQLKKYSNLPKFDIGTRPIGSGYQRNADQTQTGYFTQTAEPVTNAFVPQAISSGIQNVASPLLSIGKNAVKYISEYRSVLPSALEDSAAKYANLYAKAGASSGIAEDAFVKAGQTAAKNTAKSAASKAIGAANIALNAYGAIHGGIDLINNWKDSSTLSSEDLSNMASRSTEYVNGVAYDRIGGYDSSGVDKYVRDQNKASKIGGITSGLEAGAGIGGLIGSIFPGAGTLIGSGIGAVVGALGGLFGGGHARRKRERAIAEAKRNYANAANAYNSQNESEAASTGMRNMYYATHGIGADCGKGVKRYNNGKQPALVGQGEVQGTVDSNGNIVEAHTVDSPNGVHRLDNILTFLGDNDFVLGNKKDQSGTEVSQYARMHEKMFNSGNPALQKLGEKGLKNDLELQKRLPKNSNPNPFDILIANNGKNMKKCNMGKCLPMFDSGFWKGSELPIANYLLNYVDNNARRKQIEREPIQVNESYAPNPYISQAGALMPTMVDVSPELSDLNDQVRMANYAINQSAYTPGQRMAMLSQLYNNSIKNRSKIIASKTDRENAMRQQYAQWLSQVGESDATRRQQSRATYNKSKQQAYAQKRLLLDNIAKDNRGNLNNFFQNLNNVYWGNKDINLFQQDTNRKYRELIENMGKINKPVSKSTLAHDINSLKFNPTYKLFNPTYSLSDAMFGNFSPFFHFKIRR